MVKIKGPSRDIAPPSAKPADTVPSQATTTLKTTSVPAEGVATQADREKLQAEGQRRRKLHELPHRQLIGGAASLFNSVYFPSNLLDTTDSKNDPKYMRLLADVLGLDEFSDYIYRESQDDESDDAESDGDPDDGTESN